MDQQNEATASLVKPYPETFFSDISTRLEKDVQKQEWTNRPRTWFILNQIKRVDAMEAFITQGLNDTSLPYKGRSSLPNTLNVYEANDFLKWQDWVISDVLLLERGKHVRIPDGDVLFESRRRKLGVGSQGSTVVDRVVSKATGKTYARKRIHRKMTFGRDTQAQKVYENELKVLFKVAEDDHLIKVRGTYSDKKYMVMLLEPVAEQNLKQYMNGRPLTSAIEQQRFRTYFGCLAHTIRFLHDPPIETLHKDIKPENILLKDGRVILTDFGTAFDWSKTGQSMTRSNAGDPRTPRYQSPEVATSSEFHRSSDIWSLGVVFLEMVTLLRGREIAEMDTFLQNNGSRHCEIHLNLDAAMNWFEQLQAHGTDSPIDNEPLSWIKRMLNREHSNRPTAAAVYDDIAAFHDGMFCGRCCLDAESSSSEDDELTDSDMLSDVIEGNKVSLEDPWTESNDRFKSPNATLAMEEAPQGYTDTLGLQGDQRDSLSSHVIETDNARLSINSGGNAIASVRTEKRVRHHSKAQAHFTRPLPRKKELQGQDGTQISDPTLGASSTSKLTTKAGSKPFFDIEPFVRWLATIPESFKAPLSESRRLKPARIAKRLGKRHPTVESQRIGHFLFSLPEEPSQYENSPRAQPVYQQDSAQSLSQEELPTLSHLLKEEPDDDQFSRSAKSRLVHYASDNALNLALAMPKQTLREASDELRAFAAINMAFTPRSPESTTIREPDKVLIGASEDLGTHLEVEAGSNFEEVHPRPRSQVPDVSSTVSHQKRVSQHPSLAAYLKGVPKKHRHRWESATVIMERILDDKISEAPTSLMSANTRATVSQSRPILRWNDRSYGYLPKFVAGGKVGGVRALLSAGCNPGTAEKPRWAPIHNAIRGASDKHTKCLRELVFYGVNVNAVRSTNGRTPLHYAVEKPPWPGYSSVIYTLLAAKADPNAKDKSNDVPLLMLLAGGGQLPKEKRDALYLLLAPNFATDLNVSIPGTLDNPLHLAVRRKDAYTVDVILEKMKQVQGVSLSLIHNHNGSGFTPLLLAFTIFTLSGQEADEELQIIKLLLENGANPNIQDVSDGGTPLHLVVRASKNSIALELLCRHSANASLRNTAGQSAIDVAQNLRLEHAKDRWYSFAKRRMSNTLKDEHYRPPALVSFLDDEQSTASVKGSANGKEADASNASKPSSKKNNPTLR